MRSHLRRLIKEQLPAASAGRCYFFNSFFYKKLTESTSGGGDARARQRTLGAEGSLERTPEQLGFDRVRKWTRVSFL